jgi:hypothetical protein
VLCPDEVTLIEQRTALVYQLQQPLYEYYPAALEAFHDWTHVSVWAFVERFPIPQTLVQAGKRKWQNFLHAQKLFHPEWNQKRMEIFARADQFCGAEATIAAKSALAVATVKMLQTSEVQLTRYRLLITECFKQHPDHGLFASLPGAGPEAGSAAYWANSLRSSRWPTCRMPCSAWRAWLRSVTSRAKCPLSTCVTNATASCEPPFICGWTSAVIIATGRESITTPTAKKATARPVRCAAWECAGSKSSRR